MIQFNFQTYFLNKLTVLCLKQITNSTVTDNDHMTVTLRANYVPNSGDKEKIQ
jgi:hypothetical protein